MSVVTYFHCLPKAQQCTRSRSCISNIFVIIQYSALILCQFGSFVIAYKEWLHQLVGSPRQRSWRHVDTQPRDDTLCKCKKSFLSVDVKKGRPEVNISWALCVPVAIGVTILAGYLLTPIRVWVRLVLRPKFLRAFAGWLNFLRL